MVASIIALLLKAVQGDAVGVLASLELVFLQQLFVLEVAVLGLNSVKLVAQGEVVLVPLLDFEDLSLKLGDQQVFLVAGKVHTVVILQNTNWLVSHFTYS